MAYLALEGISSIPASVSGVGRIIALCHSWPRCGWAASSDLRFCALHIVRSAQFWPPIAYNWYVLCLCSSVEVMLRSKAKLDKCFFFFLKCVFLSLQPEHGLGYMPWIIFKCALNIKCASLLLFCQDLFLFCLHLMDTVLETLQNKSPDIFSLLVIKCTLANLCLVLIHYCNAWAEARSIIWIVVKSFKSSSTSLLLIPSWFKHKHCEWR